MIYTTVRQILPLANIRRERVLPVQGRVVARRMQKVTPTDVVAEATLEPQHMMIDLTQGLNVSVERAEELLQRQTGEMLTKGDVIAGPVGLFQRVVRAPFDCEVKLAAEGKVLLEKETPPYQLLAGMEGTVTNIIPDRGVIVETRGAVIQGVWGNGHIAHGVIQALDRELNQAVQPEQLDISFRGAIAIGGYCANAEFLQTAASIPVKGVVLGGMSSALIPAAKEVDFPIIVIDGFGKRAMNKSAVRLILSNDDKEMSINAQEYDQNMGDYPEIIISLPSPDQADPPQKMAEFSVGKEVFILTGPHASRIGTIEILYSKDYTFPNGIQTSAAEIDLGREEHVRVPLTNLEIIES